MGVGHISMEVYRLEEKITDLINGYSNQKAQCEGDLRETDSDFENISLRSKISCYAEIIEDLKELL